MPEIKCESCGKRYDFPSDETCPKCGAFNTPPAKTGAGFREEPVSRRTVRHPAGRTAAPAKEAPLGGGKGTRQVPIAPRRTPRRNPVFPTVLFFIVAVVSILSVQFAGDTKTSEPVASEAGLQWLSHDFGEEFSIGHGISVRVTGGGVITGEDGLAGLPQGKTCMYLDIEVQGGSGESAAEADLSEPHLWCEEEGLLSPETDNAQLQYGLEDFGVSLVDFSDCRQEDPLNGQIVFLVPADSTEFSFGLEQYDEQSGVTYMHKIDFYIE